MARFTPILLGLTFVMSVVTMVLVLLLFVAKPWDVAITEAELSEILQAAQETSSEEKEADRVAKCETVTEIIRQSSDPAPMVQREVISAMIENRCLPSP
jgi:hypothetical protein